MDRKDEVDWSRHTFSLEEAQGVKPELVRKLRVSACVDSDFPLQILEYKNMTDLSITGLSALHEVPEQLGELNHLIRLSISRTPLEWLPEAIFNLPELQLLHLNNNQLTYIPDNISLPSLKVATFDGNKLATLPDSLPLQPQLSRLSLKNNPWVSLPPGCNSVKWVELVLADKQRLLDHEYKGADGKGLVEWDDSMYLVKSDAELQALMLDTISDTVLDVHKDDLIQQAFKAICINTSQADDYTRVGCTRFGGMPDLPAEASYPRFENPYKANAPYHYLFYAQLNCKELAPFQGYLPRKGMLYFYIEEEDEFTCKVIYHPGDENLQSAKVLADIDFRNTYVIEPYAPYSVECRPMVSLPRVVNGEDWYELAEESGSARCDVGSREFFEKLGRQGVYRSHNSVYYADMNHSINEHSQGVAAGSPNVLAATDHKGNAEDWMVLLRMYSDDKCGFQFNDAGELYFMIHKSDLAKADFSKVYAYVDSS